MGPKRVDALLDLGARVLSDSSHIFEDHDTQREAEELLAMVLGIETDDLDDRYEPTARQRERYLALVARRAGGEPFPLLMGRINFYGLDLKVKAGTFMPRPSSELAVERAVKRLRTREHPLVVDVCTGTGPIALAIADEIPEAEVWGTDIDRDQLVVGRANARRLEISNVRFRAGDMFGALPNRLAGSVDIITGHIPYVPPEEIEDLPAEVRDHEPLFTLTDLSEDGLGLIRAAVEEAPVWLKPGGWLLLEVSDDLGKGIRKMCRKAGLEDRGIASDEDELSIIVEARKPR